MKKAILPFVLACLGLVCACGQQNDYSIPSLTQPEFDPTSSKTAASLSKEPSSSAEAPYNRPTVPILPSEAFERKNYEDSKTGKMMPYRLYLPDGYDGESPYPVLFFLHGAGERGVDNMRQLTNSFPKLFENLDSPIYGSIIVCPQCPELEQWVDTPYSEGNYRLHDVPASEVMRTLQGLIRLIQREYSVDEDRLYVMGVSIGGFGTWDICQRNPDQFAAAVPICGGGSPEDAAEIAHLPITTVHGTADQSVPVSATREMIKALRDAGGEPIYYELEGYPHNVWDWTFENQEIINWLFQQRRVSEE